MTGWPHTCTPHMPRYLTPIQPTWLPDLTPSHPTWLDDFTPAHPTWLHKWLHTYTPHVTGWPHTYTPHVTGWPHTYTPLVTGWPHTYTPLVTGWPHLYTQLLENSGHKIIRSPLPWTRSYQRFYSVLLIHGEGECSLACFANCQEFCFVIFACPDSFNCIFPYPLHIYSDLWHEQ